MKQLILFLFLINFHGYSQINLVIDSVFFRSQISTYSPQGIEYYKIPKDKIDSFSFSALISNYGTTVITDCYVQVKVFKNNMMIFNEQSNIVSLASQSQDSIFLDLDFTIPNEIGSYVINYRLMTSANEYVNNLNNKYVDFTVDNYTLSRHNNYFNYVSDTLVTGNKGIGYTFEVSEEACLSNTLVYTTTNSFDQLVQLKAELWEQDKQTNAFDRKAISEIMYPGLVGNINPVQLNFNAFLLEPSKRYFIGVYNIGNSFTRVRLAQNSEENNIFKMTSTSIVPGGINWEIEPADTNLIPMIEIQFNHSASCSSLLSNEKSMQIINPIIYPNPFNEEINFNLSGDNNSIIIFDIQGNIVLKSIIKNNAVLNTSNIKHGIYIYDIYNDKNVLINRGKIIKN